MSLREKIEQDLIDAQKSRVQATVETLRFLLSAIKYKEVDTKTPLTDEQLTEVLAKQVKTHKESIEAFQKGNRPDLVLKEQSQLKILESYLPARLGEDEVKERVIKKLSESRVGGAAVDFAMLMKSVMIELKGQADGSLVKKIVEEVLKEG